MLRELIVPAIVKRGTVWGFHTHGEIYAKLGLKMWRV